MAIKAGYKQTDAGVIPDDWIENTVGELIKFEGGSQPPRSTFHSSMKPGYIRLIQIRDYKTDKYVTYVQKKLVTKFCAKDDIMIGRYGPPIFQILRGLEGAYNVALMKAIPTDRINRDYAYYFLKQEILFEYIEKLSQRSSGQTGVDLTELKNYPLPLPPTIVEQKVIAETLSDTDALIGALEKLITKKRQIKQGAMQELLTGKRRLPGFEKNAGYKQTEIGEIPEDWKIETLGQTTTLMTNGFVGSILQHYDESGNGVLYIQGYNVEENSFNLHGIKYVTKEFHHSHMKSCLCGGDLLTIQTGDVGLTTIVPDKLAGSNCHALIISRFNKKHYFPQYVAYYLNSKPGRARLRLIETGTTMKHLNVGDMLNFIVPLPPTLAEQEAIAIALKDMDTEIDALEIKLSKTRKIKQGMMQELLTGKIRLV
jgi:type I restriction enzyme, S subunit